MTIDFALEYIPRRMKELGYGADYHLRLRHLTFGPVEVRTLEAYNQLIILVEMSYQMRVESSMGVVDFLDTNLRDYQYEHTGLITMTNRWEVMNEIKYIQAIPKKEKQCQ